MAIFFLLFCKNPNLAATTLFLSSSLSSKGLHQFPQPPEAPPTASYEFRKPSFK
ncbi:protein-lysine methyltransferase METTL21B-like protein [Corchorus capsularis]|uniref:Protein-lysine methyltransferase METTL21B-like protein n=1 Tax=Corchorus capsularis TaxID=210143 RepID=A0A1R3GSL4_COCAP|nr:protein-lysine methyltransferase METTL21B-like protein [Corchorus capsularis]